MILSYYRGAVENILVRVNKAVGYPSVTIGKTCRVFCFIVVV